MPSNSMTFPTILFLIPIPLPDIGTDRNHRVLSTFLNDKVAKIHAARQAKLSWQLKNPELAIVQAQADALVDVANKTPRQQELAQEEIEFEADKLKKAEARAEKKALKAATEKKSGLTGAATEKKTPKPRKPRAKKSALVAPGLQEASMPMLEPATPMPEPSIPMPAKATKAPLIDIITLFFIYETSELVGRGKKQRIKKKQHVMMLWADGPSSRLVTGLPRYCIDEYKHANLRGVDGGCEYCKSIGSHNGDQEKFAAHVDWHSKFRKFFPLREEALAGFSSVDPAESKVDRMMCVLTFLWQQVSPAVAYFKSDAFNKLCATFAAESAFASASAPAASTSASTSASASASTSTSASSPGPENPLGSTSVPGAEVGMRRVRLVRGS
jgi:hypothetical protein